MLLDMDFDDKSSLAFLRFSLMWMAYGLRQPMGLACGPGCLVAAEELA